MLAGSPAGINGKNLEFATDKIIPVQRLLELLPAQRKFPTVDTSSYRHDSIPLDVVLVAQKGSLQPPPERWL